MPKVSIIVPIYNVEQYVARTIESVLSQSLNDFELLLVDDCGLDNSIEICREYAIKDPRIIVIEQSSNVGPMQTRQTGIEASSGEYFFFLDGDDTLTSNALELLYHSAKENGSEIVRGQIDLVDTKGDRAPFVRDYLPYKNTPEGIIRALLEGKIKHNLASALFSRHIVMDYNYIVQENMRNGEDGLLFYQMVQRLSTPMKILNDVVYLYYMNEESSSHRRLSDKAISGLVFFYDYISDLPYPSLRSLALNYSTKNMNEFALSQGNNRMKTIVRNEGKYPYLSLFFRLKHMTLVQNLRFYIKLALNNIKKYKYEVVYKH